MFFRILITAGCGWAIHAHAFSAVTTPSTSINEDVDTLGCMRKIHEEEIARGLETFAKTTASPTIRSWIDDDFNCRHVGPGNAGSDANVLQNGECIFETCGQVVSDEECAAIIAEARQVIADGLKDASEISDSRARTNSQLGEATLSSMPQARTWLREVLQERFLPLLESRFGVSGLTLYDGLVLGTHAPSRSQPIHRDASLLTLNVALSAQSDFQGGGTYIEALDETLKIDRGHLLCHAGSTMHAGVGLKEGERWVLVLFVLAQDQPQIARRCHAEALLCLQEAQPNLEQAERVLKIGLAVAPNDHLLHFTMGRVHMARQDLNKAFKSFQQSDVSYPLDLKALVSTAQIMLDRRRPRAALRRFDQVLKRIDNRDLQPDSQMSLKSLGWAARKDAARCALLCAEHVSRRDDDQAWNCQYLPIAIDRIHTCLGPAPNDTNLLGMLRRAKVLLEDAENSDI